MTPLGALPRRGKLLLPPCLSFCLISLHSQFCLLPRFLSFCLSPLPSSHPIPSARASWPTAGIAAKRGAQSCVTGILKVDPGAVRNTYKWPESPRIVCFNALRRHKNGQDHLGLCV